MHFSHWNIAKKALVITNIYSLNKVDHGYWNYKIRSVHVWVNTVSRIFHELGNVVFLFQLQMCMVHTRWMLRSVMLKAWNVTLPGVLSVGQVTQPHPPRNFLVQQGKPEGFDSCDRPSNLKLDSNRQFFRPCDREIWWMTSKNNRALLLYYVKLCASFQIHWWIQTGFTVQKRSNRVEIGDMLSRVTLKFDGWPWKTTGHLFYATSSFV